MPKHLNTLNRVSVLAATALLAGCSALQVDVDVYKGPLLNEQEVQQRQYAYLAMSAKPLIFRLRNLASSRFQACEMAQCAHRENFKNACAFFEEIAAMYDNDNNDLHNITASRPRLDGLTRDISYAYLIPPDSMPEAQRLEKIRAANAALTEAMIYFAQRILFVVNFEAIFPDLGDTDLAFKSYKSILQSLANTILLHTNDLHRQAQRETDQRRRAGYESEAIVNAFKTPPAEAFDSLVKHLTQPNSGSEGSAAGSTPTPSSLAQEQAKLASLETALAGATARWADYRKDAAGLIATYLTLVGDPARLLPQDAVLTTATDLKAAERDRKAVAALYPKAPVDELDMGDGGSLIPLNAWLAREMPARASLDRQTRLALVRGYLETEKARLLANIGSSKTKAQLLAAMTLELRQNLLLTGQQWAELKAATESSQGAVAQLTGKLASMKKALDKDALDAANAQAAASEAGKVRAVMAAIRARTLAATADIGAIDDTGLQAAVKAELTSLAAGSRAGGFSAQDIALTLTKVSAWSPVQAGTCSSTASKCAGKTQMEVIDTLIASLRAQHVKALSKGKKDEAGYLLEAINAAYSQRTAMIYLRPASDYLRSVHSASELQDSTEQQYRLMLNDWGKYLRPDDLISDTGKHKLELEKVYWQNINRVTLGGGGLTNFVLTKDDVGNWYVKAYSSDPEVIFKSAANLALFNAGSRLNTNLLQRYQLQQRIDDAKDGPEKAGLNDKLEALNSRDGRPLLALRNSYARQYDNSTTQIATRLQAQLSGIATAVDKLVDDAADSPKCDRAAFKTSLKGAEAPLASPRDRLSALNASARTFSTTEQAESTDEALLAGLSGLQAYSGRVYQALEKVVAPECDADWRRKLAERARDLPRQKVRELARERLNAIERYEDAMANITDVATQKQ